MLPLASAYSQAPTFADKVQHYEFTDGGTVIMMNCNGVGPHYETMLYVANGKMENYFQGIVYKGTLEQISARRTSKTVFSNYVWEGDRIIQYNIKGEHRANYREHPEAFIANDNTVDLCGLLYQMRCGAASGAIEAETLLVDGDTLPLRVVGTSDNGRAIAYSIVVGDGYHVSGRIRKDEDRTPEYLDIDIPGFSIRATLVERDKRLSKR